MPLRLLDTFAGTGGFKYAAEMAFGKSQIECVGAIEIDSIAREFYKINHNHTPLEDITKVDIESLPNHDLLTGGFPCQPFSRNGKIFNFQNKDNKNYKTLEEDDRANLVQYLIKILLIKRPSYFIFENVKEILTIKNKDGSSFLDSLLRELVECGYKVEYKLMNTNDFGIPQQRKRVYFVGIREDVASKRKPFTFPEKIKVVTSVEDILDSKVSSKYLLENMWKNRIIRRHPKGASKVNHSIPENGSRLEALKEIAKNEILPSNPTGKVTPIAILYGDTPSGLPRQQDKLYSIKGISPTIATFSTPCFDAPEGWRQLTPKECARLQGFPESHILPNQDSIAYKQVGNAITVKVAEEILKNLLRI